MQCFQLGVIVSVPQVFTNKTIIILELNLNIGYKLLHVFVSGMTSDRYHC